MNKRVDIFIPSSNDVTSLLSCLSSLNAQSHSIFRIIIIAIVKQDEVEKYLKKTSLDCVYRAQKSKGLVGAANEALSLSKSEFFTRIDDDVIVDRNWLKNIIVTFDADSAIGIVTGPTLVNKNQLINRDLLQFLTIFKKSKNIALRLLYFIYNSIIYENNIKAIGRFFKSGAFGIGANFEPSTKLKQSIDVTNIEACNFTIRTKLLKKIGGFDMSYNRGLGDYHEADIAYKTRKIGYRIVFNPKVTVNHHIAPITSHTRSHAYYRIQNFIFFYKRHIAFRNLDYFLRFLLNLAAQNCYYMYQFFRTGRIDQLGALPGSIIALFSKTK